MSRTLKIVDHPLIQHKLTQMRRKDTPSGEFRRALRELSLLLAYEVTRDLPLKMTEIETPVARTLAPEYAGRWPCLVSILRAGNGLLDGFLDLIPSARVGHLGLYRDPTTLEAIEYYCKLPEDIGQRDVMILDPMLATGHSAVAAVSRVKELSPPSIRYVCLLAAPEGVKTLHDAYADVPIYTAALDSHLNDHGYIIPGLGDAGDRLFGTR